MRVTIMKDDAVVGVDGVFRTVNLSAMPEEIRVIQWNGTSGHIEYNEGPNSVIDDIGGIQVFIDLWTAAAPPPPPEPAPAERIAAAHARVNAAYSAAVHALTAGYPENEIASWPKQEAEARTFLADNAASTPWLDSAAAARGIAKAELVTLIMGSADALAPLHGQLTGKRQKLRDRIAALGDYPSQQQLDEIQW